MEARVEVVVGERSFEHGGKNLIEKIRFAGRPLGHYTVESMVSEDRLTKHEAYLSLYECPDGYRIAKSIIEFRRRRERARWSKKTRFTELLPAIGNSTIGEFGKDYGVYSEEEARREYPELFSAVGIPNVRNID